jgi:hypothetical protein
MDSRAFSGELVWFASLLGEGNNLESILLISPWQIYQTLYLFFRMQKCRLQLPLRVQECRPNSSGCGNDGALQGEMDPHLP